MVAIRIYLPPFLYRAHFGQCLPIRSDVSFSHNVANTLLYRNRLCQLLRNSLIKFHLARMAERLPWGSTHELSKISNNRKSPPKPTKLRFRTTFRLLSVSPMRPRSSPALISLFYVSLCMCLGLSFSEAITEIVVYSIKLIHLLIICLRIPVYRTGTARWPHLIQISLAKRPSCRLCIIIPRFTRNTLSHQIFLLIPTQRSVECYPRTRL